MSQKRLHIFLGMSTVFSSYAVEISVQSPREFTSVVKGADHGVVLFYQQPKKINLYSEVNRLKSMFNQMSQDNVLKYTDVEFVRVNIENLLLQSIAQDLGIEEFPSFVLFKDGDFLRDASGNLLILCGYVSRRELKRFIECHLNSSINEVLHEKERQTKLRSFQLKQQERVLEKERKACETKNACSSRSRVSLGFGLYGWPYGYYGNGFPYYGGYGWRYPYCYGRRNKNFCHQRHKHSHRNHYARGCNPCRTRRNHCRQRVPRCRSSRGCRR